MNALLSLKLGVFVVSQGGSPEPVALKILFEAERGRRTTNLQVRRRTELHFILTKNMSGVAGCRHVQKPSGQCLDDMVCILLTGNKFLTYYEEL